MWRSYNESSKTIAPLSVHIIKPPSRTVYIIHRNGVYTTVHGTQYIPASAYTYVKYTIVVRFVLISSFLFVFPRYTTEQLIFKRDSAYSCKIVWKVNVKHCDYGKIFYINLRAVSVWTRIHSYTFPSPIYIEFSTHILHITRVRRTTFYRKMWVITARFIARALKYIRKIFYTSRLCMRCVPIQPIHFLFA